MNFPVRTMFFDETAQARIEGIIRPSSFVDIVQQHQWRYPSRSRDRHWDWFGIWMSCQTEASRYECYSALVGESLQALVCLGTEGRRTDVGEALAVDYLATNPENRREGGIKYLGLALMAVAVRRSVERGFEGRVWLESLPTRNTLRFYSKIGMTRLTEISEEGFPMFVFEVDASARFLKLVEQKGIIR